jgi:C_GCAxxG_C_C family probable redox protein
MRELIKSRVHDYYWNNDLNCAETTLKTLSEIFCIEIEPQVLDAAIGMHGAGKFGAQCGLVEGSLMFIGILGKQKGIEKEKIIALCYQFADRFEDRFKSLRCKDLRPQGFRPDDPPHLCEGKSKIVINFCAEFITKACEGYI